MSKNLLTDPRKSILVPALICSPLPTLLSSSFNLPRHLLTIWSHLLSTVIHAYSLSVRRGYTHVSDTSILSNRIVQLELVISRLLKRVDDPVAYTDLLHDFEGPLPIFRPNDSVGGQGSGSGDTKNNEQNNRSKSDDNKAGTHVRFDRSRHDSRSDTEQEQDEGPGFVPEAGVNYGYGQGMERNLEAILQDQGVPGPGEILDMARRTVPSQANTTGHDNHQDHNRQGDSLMQPLPLKDSQADGIVE